MHSRATGCWTAQMLDGFQGLQKCEEFVQAVWRGAPIRIQEFTNDVRHRLHGVWNTAVTNAVPVPRCSVSLYESYFGVPSKLACPSANSWPFVSKPLAVLRNVGRFRLRAHTLRVNRAIWSQGEELPFVIGATCRRIKMRPMSTCCTRTRCG